MPVEDRADVPADGGAPMVLLLMSRPDSADDLGVAERRRPARRPGGPATQ